MRRPYWTYCNDDHVLSYSRQAVVDGTGPYGTTFHHHHQVTKQIYTHTHLEMYKRDFRLINTHTHSQSSIWWWLVISGRLSAAAIIWCSSKTLRASRKINVSQSVVACLILSTHQLHSAVVLSPNRLINTLMMLLLLLLLKHYQSHQSYWYTTE